MPGVLLILGTRSISQLMGGLFDESLMHGNLLFVMGGDSGEMGSLFTYRLHELISVLNV